MRKERKNKIKHNGLLKAERLRRSITYSENQNIRKIIRSESQKTQKTRESETQNIGNIRVSENKKIWYYEFMIKDVTDLEVYQYSLVLLEELYNFLRRIPKSEYDSVVQCKKAGKSIPALIAEGFAKRSSEAEFKRFLKMAIGSSDEIVSHLRTIMIAVSRLADEAQSLAEKYKILSKRLNKLHQVWHSDKF